MSQHYPGYIVPAEPQPEGFYCLKVYIPADDLYLYAFSGAYQFFGKWLAWQRDQAHNASLAAAAWRDAIQYTFDNGWLNCGEDDNVCEHCDLIPVILAKLEELSNMNINVSTGCGCGCGCQQVQDPNEGVTDDDLCLPPDPSETPPPSLNLAQKCNQANYMVVELRTALLNIIGANQNYPNFSGWWLALWAYLPTALVLSISYSAWVAVNNWLRGKGTDFITSNFDPQTPGMVCALFSADTPAGAKSDLFAILDTFPYPLNLAARSFAASLPYDGLFSTLTLNMPPGFSNRECCGSVPDSLPMPPDPPAGYRLVAAHNGEFEFVPNAGTGSGQYSQTYAEFVLTPLTTENYHEVMVNVDVSDIVTRENVASLHGLLVQFTSNLTYNENDGLQVNSNTGGALVRHVSLVEFVHYDNAEYGAVTEFADYIDQFDNGTDYGNDEMTDAKASFRLQSYGILPSAAQIKCRVFYIAKEL